MRILFQGDSITDGGRLKPVESRWDLNHQIGHSYVFYVVGTLGRKSPGKYTFINRGVSGDHPGNIGPRWQEDTLDEHPDVLSLLLGVNGNGKMDGSYPEGLEEHLCVFEKQYRELLESARTQNPALKIILIEPFVLPVGQVKTHYADFMPVMQRKQAIVRRIAEDYQAVFVAVQEPLENLVRKTAPQLKVYDPDADPYRYWMWDGIHPTEPMHVFLAELWLEAEELIL